MVVRGLDAGALVVRRKRGVGREHARTVPGADTVAVALRTFSLGGEPESRRRELEVRDAVLRRAFVHDLDLVLTGGAATHGIAHVLAVVAHALIAVVGT